MLLRVRGFGDRHREVFAGSPSAAAPARQCARDTALFDAEFSGHRLSATVIDRVAAAFDTSVRDRAMRRAHHIAARTRIHDLITSALLDARRLDLIVDNELGHDNVIGVVWKQERRVERRRGPRSGGSESAVAALPAAAEPPPAKMIPMAQAA